MNKGELNELALFAGAGGGILGGGLLGWRTVCAVEWEPYPACVLAARQNDGILPPFPIWDDVQTFDGKPWRGIVDVVSGGFPCQDISAAGKGAGIEGSRSGMWKHMARIIDEVRPRFAFVENSPMLVGRGAAMVIGDLTEMGYDCEWCIVSASDCGAPHKRDRFWLLAYSDSERQQELHSTAIASKARQHSRRLAKGWRESWWASEPNVGRVADRVAARVDRLKAIGNGQVPICAAKAFRILSGAAVK
jgi:DNA (cytosine-5)-methyltransferase 1